MKPENYNHVIEEQVKFHEVDLLGVCNNAVYFNYFEDARIKYLQDLKQKYELKEILEDNSFFIMAKNFCDYFKPSHLDDKLLIYTKIDFIKNSSFGFQHLVFNTSNKEVIAHGGGVVVHIQMSNQKSQPLPDEFYNAVQQYEGDVSIIKNKE